MTKLLVCGSRSITDSTWVSSQISSIVAEKAFSLSDLTLIEGGAKGVDELAAQWARANGVGEEISTLYSFPRHSSPSFPIIFIFLESEPFCVCILLRR